MLDDYDYDLPRDLIAQHPAEPRDHSRLMVLAPDGTTHHRRFYDIPEYLRPHDLLVVNDTRVFPARLVGVKEPTGGTVELFLLRFLPGDYAEALARPAKRLRPGVRIVFGDGMLLGEVTGKDNHGTVTVHFTGDRPLTEAIDLLGKTPLPPYITREPDATDPERYQTVYAARRGAVAAPTAGLHFTPELLAKLDKRGIGRATVTLHVGLGTFQPLTEETALGAALHREYCYVPQETVARIQDCRAAGGRVIAVGTTTVRALETAQAGGILAPFEGWTDIFLKPPSRVTAVDMLITNFHLPQSSLLMLVAAFVGRERILAAYREAVAERYRFFSYGDAMLISGAGV